MRKLLFIVSLLLGFYQIQATGILTTIGAQQAGMGYLRTGIMNPHATVNNQGLLGAIDHSSIGLSVGQRYNIQGLNSAAFSGLFAHNSGTWGLHANYNGSELYNEQRITAAYGKKLFNKLSVGIGLNYHAINQEEAIYGNANKLSFDIGIYTELREDLSIGFHAFNPNRTKVREFLDERIEPNFALGLNYHPTNGLHIGLEMEQELQQKPNFKFGFQYLIQEKFALRAGMNTEPIQLTMGFGFLTKQFDVNFAGSYHQFIGWTPQFGLIWKAKK